LRWTTGTQTECLGANSANGSANANTSVVTVISPASGVGYCPANFWLPSYGVSKSLLVKAFGVLSTTVTPTLTMAVYGDTAQNTASGTPLATTGAVTTSSGVTNINWSLEVVISNVTTGSSGTFISDGMFIMYNASTTATPWTAARCSSSAANPNTASTLSTQSAYYIELAATWSAASASNTIQVYSYTVLGLN
jgi:hypothetical protein